MEEKQRPDYEKLKARVRELAVGPSDRAAIEAIVRKMSISQKTLNREEIVAHKQEILNRVQKRAEEYYQVSRSCAKSPALAVMEEFGCGDIKIVTALTAFPGVALTGETCGAALGAIAALCAYFGSDDILDFEANGHCFLQARKLISLFEKELGFTKCYDIHRNVVFGQFYDLADMEKGRPAFIEDGGLEKCALPPGVSARIAAQLIIEDIVRGE